jgi:tRNA(His) 5'-end guanylyltransferase
MSDDLGDRMKKIEMIEAGRILIPQLPIMARLDGRSFSSFTKGLKRPFDERLTDLMIATTKFLVEETGATVALVQSDEISLCIWNDNYDTEVIFNGRFQKLTSVFASLATYFFNKELPKYIPEKANKMALFDCRVWNVPNLDEATNCFLWRELDATKNAISMAAQSQFSHKELQGKHGNEMQEMLFQQRGINFNDYPSKFKRGSFIKKVKKVTKFSTDEIEKLPKNHDARKNPNLTIERNIIERIELPQLSKIVNRVKVLFENEEPIQQ